MFYGPKFKQANNTIQADVDDLLIYTGTTPTYREYCYEMLYEKIV